MTDYPGPQRQAEIEAARRCPMRDCGSRCPVPEYCHPDLCTKRREAA